MAFNDWLHKNFNLGQIAAMKATPAPPVPPTAAGVAATGGSVLPNFNPQPAPAPAAPYQPTAAPNQQMVDMLRALTGAGLRAPNQGIGINQIMGGQQAVASAPTPVQANLPTNLPTYNSNAGAYGANPVVSAAIPPPTNPAQAAIYPHLVQAMQQSLAGNDPTYAGYGQPGVPDVTNGAGMGAGPASLAATTPNVQGGFSPVNAVSDAITGAASDTGNAVSNAAGSVANAVTAAPGAIGGAISSEASDIGTNAANYANARLGDAKAIAEAFGRAAHTINQGTVDALGAPAKAAIPIIKDISAGDWGAIPGDIAGGAKDVLMAQPFVAIPKYEFEKGAEKQISWAMTHALTVPVVGQVLSVMNMPFQGVTANVGGSIYKVAKGEDGGAWYGFAHAKDGDLDQWLANPDNKAGVINAYEQGVDLNGDGKISNDEKGDKAAFAYYFAAKHPAGGNLFNFVSTIVDSMGYDPTILLPILGEAGVGGRILEGAGTAAEAERAANVAEAVRLADVAKAADAALTADPTNAALKVAAQQASLDAANAAISAGDLSAWTKAKYYTGTALTTPEHIINRATGLPVEIGKKAAGLLPDSLTDIVTNAAKKIVEESPASKTRSEIQSGVDPTFKLAAGDTRPEDMIGGTTPFPPADGTTPFPPDTGTGGLPATGGSTPFPPTGGITPGVPKFQVLPYVDDSGKVAYLVRDEAGKTRATAPTYSEAAAVAEDLAKPPLTSGTTPATSAAEDVGGTTPFPPDAGTTPGGITPFDSATTSATDTGGTTSAEPAKPAVAAQPVPKPQPTVNSGVTSYVIKDETSPIQIRVAPAGKGSKSWVIQERLNGKWRAALDENGNRIMGGTYKSPYNPDNLAEVQSAAAQVYQDKRLLNPSGGFTPAEPITGFGVTPAAPAVETTPVAAEIQALTDQGFQVQKVTDTSFVYNADGQWYLIDKRGDAYHVFRPTAEVGKPTDMVASSISDAIALADKDAVRPEPTPVTPPAATEAPATTETPAATKPTPPKFIVRDGKVVRIDANGETVLDLKTSNPQAWADVANNTIGGTRPVEAPVAERQPRPIRPEPAPVVETPPAPTPVTPRPVGTTAMPAADILAIDRLPNNLYEVHFSDGRTRTIGQRDLGPYQEKLASQHGAATEPVAAAPTQPEPARPVAQPAAPVTQPEPTPVPAQEAAVHGDSYATRHEPGVLNVTPGAEFRGGNPAYDYEDIGTKGDFGITAAFDHETGEFRGYQAAYPNRGPQFRGAATETSLDDFLKRVPGVEGDNEFIPYPLREPTPAAAEPYHAAVNDQVVRVSPDGTETTVSSHNSPEEAQAEAERLNGQPAEVAAPVQQPAETAPPSVLEQARSDLEQRAASGDNNVGAREIFTDVETGNPLVSELYRRDPKTGALADHDVSANYDANIAKGHEEDVPLRGTDIVATQDHLFARGNGTRPGVLDYADDKTGALAAESSDPIVAVRGNDGKLYLDSGHHRVAGAILDDKPSIKMTVVNESDLHPAAAAAEEAAPAPTPVAPEPAPAAPVEYEYKRQGIKVMRREVGAGEDAWEQVDKGATWMIAEKKVKSLQDAQDAIRQAALAVEAAPDAVQAFVDRYSGRKYNARVDDPNEYHDLYDAMVEALGGGNEEKGLVLATKVQRAMDEGRDPFEAVGLTRPTGEKSAAPEAAPEPTPEPAPAPEPAPTPVAEQPTLTRAPEPTQPQPKPRPAENIPARQPDRTIPPPPEPDGISDGAMPQFDDSGFPKTPEDRDRLFDLLDSGHLKDYKVKIGKGKLADVVDKFDDIATDPESTLKVTVNDQIKIREAWQEKQGGAAAEPATAAAPTKEPYTYTIEEARRQKGESMDAYSKRAAQLREDKAAGIATLAKPGNAAPVATAAPIVESPPTPAAPIAETPVAPAAPTVETPPAPAAPVVERTVAPTTTANPEARTADLNAKKINPFTPDDRKIVDTHLIDVVEQKQGTPEYESFTRSYDPIRKKAAARNDELQVQIDDLKRERRETLARIEASGAGKYSAERRAIPGQADLPSNYTKVNTLIGEQNLNGIDATVAAADIYKDTFHELPDNLPDYHSGTGADSPKGGPPEFTPITDEKGNVTYERTPGGRSVYAESDGGFRIHAGGQDRFVRPNDGDTFTVYRGKGRATRPLPGGEYLSESEAIALADSDLPQPGISFHDPQIPTPTLMKRAVYDSGRDGENALKALLDNKVAEVPERAGYITPDQYNRVKDLREKMMLIRDNAKKSIFDVLGVDQRAGFRAGAKEIQRLEDRIMAPRKSALRDTTENLTADEAFGYKTLYPLARDLVDNGDMTLAEGMRVSRPILNENGQISSIAKIYDDARVDGATKAEAVAKALAADEIDVRSGVTPSDRFIIQSASKKDRDALMKKVESGAPLTAKEKQMFSGLSIKDQERYRRGGAAILRKWDGLNNTIKENIQHNWVTGLGGVSRNATSDIATAMFTGHGPAVLEAFRDVGTAMRVIRETNPNMLMDMPMLYTSRETGMIVPREFTNAGYTETAAGMAGDFGSAMPEKMRMQAAIDRKLNLKPGGIGEKITKGATTPFASKMVKTARTTYQEIPKIAVYEDAYRFNAKRVFNSFESDLVAKFGPDQAAQMIQDARDIAMSRVEATGAEWHGNYSPADVRDATGDTQLSRRLQGGLSDARDAAKAEANRVYFNYKQTRIDEGLSHGILFNYWASRQSMLYADLLVHNPFMASTAVNIWNQLGREAQANGTSNRLKAYIHLVGNTGHGMEMMVDPLAGIVPMYMFLDIGNSNDPWYKRAGVFMAPALEGMLAAFGMTDNVPNLTGTDAVFRQMQVIQDTLKAHGVWPGGMSISQDYAFNAHKWITSESNRVLKGMHLTGADYEPWKPQSSSTVTLRSLIHGKAEQQWGPEFGPNNELLWTSDQFNQVRDADLRAGPGGGNMEDNPLSKWAYTQYANANFSASIVKDLFPTSVRSADMVNIKKGSSDYYAAKDAGTTPTPAQADAAKTKTLIETGSPQGYDLSVQNSLYNSAGTDPAYRYGEYYSRAFTEIVHGSNPAQYLDPNPNDAATVNANILAMSTDDRKTLFDQWLQSQGPTAKAQYDAYLANKSAVKDQLPEEGAYSDWTSNMSKIINDPALLRRYKQLNPGYANYLMSLSAATRTDPDKFRAAMLSQNAYWAAQGMPGNIYNNAPLIKGQDPMGATLLGGTATDTSGSNLTPEQTLTKQITQYNSDVAAMDAALQAYTGDPNAKLSNATPMERQTYLNVLGQLGIRQPRMPYAVQRYMNWLASPASKGTDGSVHAFSIYLAGQQQALSGLLDPNNPLAQIDYSAASAAAPQTSQGYVPSGTDIMSGVFNPVPSGTSIMGGVYGYGSLPSGNDIMGGYGSGAYGGAIPSGNQIANGYYSNGGIPSSQQIASGG